MNAAIVSALAAMGGSTVGALTPLMNSYLMQRSLLQREFFNHQLSQRESLYAEFISAAAKLYATSVAQSLETLDDLVALYAIVSRIRLLASAPVLHAAEDLVRQIAKRFGDPNLDVDHIRAAMLQAGTDPLLDFSIACRRELAASIRSGLITGVGKKSGKQYHG